MFMNMFCSYLKDLIMSWSVAVGYQQMIHYNAKTGNLIYYFFSRFRCSGCLVNIAKGKRVRGTNLTINRLFRCRVALIRI